MDSRLEVLNSVCQLLDLVPGVSVLDHRHDARAARVEFAVQSEDSAHALDRISLGANVVVEPGNKEMLSLGAYAFVASTMPRDGLSSGELQLLGIHLAWYLHKIGILSAPQANALLRAWGAAQVGV